MKTEIVCCETIRNELCAAMESSGARYPVHWLPAGLHNVPKDLHRTLQTIFDQISCGRLLLAMGLCGNAISGAWTRDFELILPRADDCISLLLGQERRLALGREKPTYYLTKGWLDGERNIWAEYQYAIEKYGPKRGKMINDIMYAHYRRLGVVDTGGYQLSEIEPLTHQIADTLGLEHEIFPAGVEHICRLLTGPCPDDLYYRFPPQTRIQIYAPNANLQ